MRLAICIDNMIITFSKSIQQEMIDDFALEYGEQKKLADKWPSSPHGLRAKERMLVIESSINELKEQIKNPSRHNSYLQGGYSQEELQRIEHLPRNLNGV